MNWAKEFYEIDNMWVISSTRSDIRFFFDAENMADLMLFCLERTIA